MCRRPPSGQSARNPPSGQRPPRAMGERSALRYSSLFPPVLGPMWLSPTARATRGWRRWWPGRPDGKKASPARWCPESRCPPGSPGRGLRVCRAISSPRGTKISTFSGLGVPGAELHPTPGAGPWRIILRGTGLMAGSPTATETRLGHPAHAFAAQEDHGFPGSCPEPDPGADFRPVGDVGVVPGIFDHHRLAPGTLPAVALTGGWSGSRRREGSPPLLPGRCGPGVPTAPPGPRRWLRCRWRSPP